MAQRLFITQLLMTDHNRMKKLLDELLQTTPRAKKRRAGLVETLAHDLLLHEQMENEQFYPAMVAASPLEADHRLIDAARGEHATAKEQLGRLRQIDPGNPSFIPLVEELRDTLVNHFISEEMKILSRGEELLQREQLEALGIKLKQRQFQLKRLPPQSSPA